MSRFEVAELRGAKQFDWHPLTLPQADIETISQAAEIHEARLLTQGYSIDTLAALTACLIGHQPCEHELVYFTGLGGKYLGRLHTTTGTPAQVHRYVHEIARRGLELGAHFAIAAHSHPSGAEFPSAADEQWAAAFGPALAGVGILLSDCWVCAGGTIFSQRSNDKPASAWASFENAQTHEQSALPVARPEPLTEQEQSIVDRAAALLRTRRRAEPPADRYELRDVAAHWLSSQPVGTVGVIACDIFLRPLGCKVIATDRPARSTEMLIDANRYAIERCAVRLVLCAVVEFPSPDLERLAEAGKELHSMACVYDASVIDVVAVDQFGGRSLHSIGNFADPTIQEQPMKVFDFIEGLKRKKEKQSTEAAASLASIVRKALSGEALSKAEERLIEIGEISEAKIREGVEIRQRFDAKLAAAIKLKQRANEKEPLIKAAREKLSKLERELVETRQLAVSMVTHPEYASLASIVASAPELFDFSGEADIRAHVEREAGAPVEQAKASA